MGTHKPKIFSLTPSCIIMNILPNIQKKASLKHAQVLCETISLQFKSPLKSPAGLLSIQGLETTAAGNISLMFPTRETVRHLDHISGRRVPPYVKASRTPDSEALSKPTREIRLRWGRTSSATRPCLVSTGPQKINMKHRGASAYADDGAWAWAVK